MVPVPPKDPERIAVPADLAGEILEVLRLAPVWTLLSSEHEGELGDDFKPHKWAGYEIETANEQQEAHRKLMAVMQAHYGLDAESRPLRAVLASEEGDSR